MLTACFFTVCAIGAYGKYKFNVSYWPIFYTLIVVISKIIIYSDSFPGATLDTNAFDQLEVARLIKFVLVLGVTIGYYH